MSVTKDLTEFGIMELQEASEILKVLKTHKDKTHFLGDGVELHFNANSGMVFLSDEDYNTACLTSDGTLEDWFVCPYCGEEGFADDVKHHNDEDEDCVSWEIENGWQD